MKYNNFAYFFTIWVKYFCKLKRRCFSMAEKNNKQNKNNNRKNENKNNCNNEQQNNNNNR